MYVPLALFPLHRCNAPDQHPRLISVSGDHVSTSLSDKVLCTPRGMMPEFQQFLLIVHWCFSSLYEGCTVSAVLHPLFSQFNYFWLFLCPQLLHLNLRTSCLPCNAYNVFWYFLHTAIPTHLFLVLPSTITLACWLWKKTAQQKTVEFDNFGFGRIAG